MSYKFPTVKKSTGKCIYVEIKAPNLYSQVNFQDSEKREDRIIGMTLIVTFTDDV